MMTSFDNDNYNTTGGGNENSGKTAPWQAAEHDVCLGLNMQCSQSTYTDKTMCNPSPYHHPQYGASIEFGGGGGGGGGGGRHLFTNSMTTSNQIASATSLIYTTAAGGEMDKLIFTASQLREFEIQTLIYKHIMSSIPVPPQLLLPLSIQSNRSDSEPWRCKRTDGKKWRCSRDAMPDQRYCERHTHKNRPRSRKHVETQTRTQSQSQSQSQNTKNLDTKDNYHSTLPHTPTMSTSCQQSRWFMKSGTTPLSSSMNSPNVGSKRDNFLQNLEGNHRDLVEVDNCLLTLMQPGGNGTCDDQDLFQMGIGMLSEDGSNPCSQWAHQGSWLGGPLGEALCPGVVSSLNRSPNVTPPRES